MHASLDLIGFYGARLYAGFLDPWFPRLLALAAKALSLFSFIFLITDGNTLGYWGAERIVLDWFLMNTACLSALAILSELPPLWRWRNAFDTFYRMVVLSLFFFSSMFWNALAHEDEAAQRWEMAPHSTSRD